MSGSRVDEHDLLRLQPAEFEALCHALLHLRLGPGVEWTGAVGDKGRDMAFTGRSDLLGGIREGLWVFQAKHHRIPNMTQPRVQSQLEKDLRNELDKLKRYKTACDHYVLMTNGPGPKISDWIASDLKPEFPDIKTLCVVDGRRISEWLNAPQAEHLRKQFFPTIIADAMSELAQNMGVLQAKILSLSATGEFTAEERRSASWLEDARLLLDNCDWAEARRKLEGMASQKDALPAKLRAKHHNLWGVLHARLGHFEDCLREMQTARGLDPDEAKIAGNYFSILDDQNKRLSPQETSELEKALKRNHE